MSRDDSRMLLQRIIGLLVLLLSVEVAACASGTTTEDSGVPVEPTESVAGRLTFAGSTTMQPLVEQLAVAYRQQYPNVELEVAAGGSVVGINAVQDGSADIGMASRELREEELLPGVERYHVASDALAIIVHPDNPVRQLTVEQLQGIYTGEITNWREVDGVDSVIIPVVREVSSGTRGAFDDIVLGDRALMETIDVQVTAGEVEARVASRPDAIGYVGFGNIGSDVVVISINNVEPTPQTIQSSAYPLQRPLLLLTGSLSRELSQSFVDFALSTEGQGIVNAEGWVPVQ
ncbi:MAG: phosphate ABC transporter substrate-binding protein [Chloroflexi bacterium AL-W]|nr:phosphate ABC transporter substrate-binding protein [Chloroflexi bacterium AL-N1]NOK70928.1 phosphate ABC transporter substrate-binding protein [Chloroflexi bacterium AL-N10]NOK73201.1 phosphate ABC transporter substrate-binding protein [Chloroflexi bacterium AL-N5]NOK80098.1 phosphate ABC transporter substrate-binding protein [Chloroflexi bacterium AL-W]NOK88047.1 phosphate ABC transporter substrate-binding protein [Chloroflexi bacterium AL-N15]